MKKILSMFMSIVMLFSITAGMNITANAEDNGTKTIASATLTPVKPYEIYEGGYDGYDEEGNGFYMAPDFNQGDKIDIVFTDGTKDTFTLSYDGFNNANDSQLYVSFCSFYFDGLGETTAYYEIYGCDNYEISKYYEVSATVNIVENPVESFTLTLAKPYEIVEKANGWNEGETWYYWAPDFNEGDIINVNYTNGTTDTFTCDGCDFYNKDDEYLRVYQDGFNYTGIGQTTFTVKLYDYGKSIDVPVTIIENPVESFTFSPAKPYEIMENTNGYYDGEEDWYYYLEDFNYGDKIIVNYKKGNKDTFEYKGFTGDYVFFNEKNDGLNVSKYSFYYDGVGETSFEVKLDDYNKSTYVPVTITENPVESFTLKPVKPYEIVENTNRWFDEGGSGWYYESPDFNNGDEITVNYTNGTTDTFIFTNGKFINESGKVLQNVRGSLFKFDGLGETTFEVELFDYNKSIEVPVKIVAASNPGGGSTGGGGGGGFVPAPTPEEPATEPTTEPTTKPTAPTTSTTTVKKPSTVKVLKVTKGIKSFKVTWKKKTGVSGYQVQYATDKKLKKNKKTVTVAKKNATSKTIKKLKSKKTYYVRVRAYKIVNGKKVYSSWSKVKSVKTK